MSAVDLEPVRIHEAERGAEVEGEADPEGGAEAAERAGAEGRAEATRRARRAEALSKGGPSDR